MHDTAPAERSDRVALAGIFVGGASARWGGVPKGLLRLASGQTLVERWRTLFDALAIETVLVGHHPAYAGLGLDCIADEPAGIGPLGGLIALLSRADGRSVIAVACDMPHVGRPLVERLATHPSKAPALAPKRADMWEPWFTRYAGLVPVRAARQRAALGMHSLQGLLDDLHADLLDLSETELEELRDWDCPQDVPSGAALPPHD
jgi:molybdopterin-guanine dinucleotide biosynthesis protein A